MTRRRLVTAAGFMLLLLGTLVVAEATLAALVLLFSLVLRLNLTLDLGPPAMVNSWIPILAPHPQVALHSGALTLSILFTAVCGLGAGVRRYLMWRAEP